MLEARPSPMSIRAEAVRIEGEKPATTDPTRQEEFDMGRVVVFNHLTLDGVMQAPGRPDEDRRGGFEHGGWAAPRMDPAMADAVGEGSWEFLFGRRTYQDFASFWPHQPVENPFAAALNNGQKYVASRTLQEPLAWQNSTLLKGDAAEAVAGLKEQGKDLLVFGSGELVQSLMRRNLVDEYVLLIHPLVLGTGRRLFAEGSPPTALRLLDSKTTTTGVVIATYQPAEPTAGKTI
jgi:dihydrofolate reductase